MAFIDKLGQVANKVGEVAGDTFDYSKAKGKAVLEKGKIKDIKESIGDYVYETISAGGNIQSPTNCPLLSDFRLSSGE